MSQPSPNRPRDLANVAIRRADQGAQSQTTRQNFYISPSRAAPQTRIPSPLQSSFTLRDQNPNPNPPASDVDSLRSGHSGLSTPKSPYTPAPLQISSSNTSSPTRSTPPSPYRVKGSSGDKAFDSVKAVATRHALLEQSREVARARDGHSQRQQVKSPSEVPSMAPSGTTPRPRLPQRSESSPASGSQAMASTPISVRTDAGSGRSAAPDSSMSLSNSPSSAFQTFPIEDPELVDVPALIAAAGSPEAAIRKLLREKHMAAQNNAQLWRLLNKQKTVLTDLNKDLQKAVKDRDRYRKKLKEQLMSATAGVTIPGSAGNSSSHDRDGSKSPSVITPLDEVPAPGSRISSLASDRTNDEYATLAPHTFNPHQPPTPNSAAISPMYVTPMPAPFSAHSDSGTSNRSGEGGVSPAVPEYRVPTGTPATLLSSHAPSTAADTSDESVSLIQRTKQGSFSAAVKERTNPVAQRKGPPAPLDLSPQKEPAGVSPGSSEYASNDSGGLSGHGGVSAGQERESGREMSNMKKQEREESATDLSITSSPGGYSSMDEPGSPQVAQIQTYQSLNALNTTLKTPLVGEYSPEIKRALAQPSVASPGLPVSPRPVDRPANAAPPRPVREPTGIVPRQLDHELKSASNFRMKLPDRNLFAGHAPARIDARRSALSAYFGYMLEASLNEKATGIVSSFFSSDAIGAESVDYFQASHAGSAAMGTPGHPAPKPRKDGYLTKKGKNFGGWKARYFVLDGPVFKYFEAPGGAQLGTIKLQHASIGRQTGSNQDGVEEENQFRHAFLIMEPKRRDKQNHIQHVLCAESDEERDIWVRCLMQYIEDEEAERPRTATKPIERSESLSNNSPRAPRSMNDVRKVEGQHGAPSNSSQNQLRAVRYDNTVAADAPVIGPSIGTTGPPANSMAPPPLPPLATEDIGDKAHNTNNSPHPLISGPTNAVVIQDASTWGNRREPNLLTKDRAKRMDSVNKDQNPQRERKRSIFAFTGRASTDSTSRDSTGTSQAGDMPQHRPVFGMPLAEVIEYASPTDVPVQLPAVVYRCLEYLRGMDAKSEEGIFRMSGSNVVIKALRERFNTEGDVKLLAPGEQMYDIHAVASLLKLYLRELPATILTRDLHLDFVKCLELDDHTRIDAFNILVNRLPPANRELMDKLTGFLREIVDHENVNKMNVRNVGIVFSPTLNIPGPLITIFVTDYARIFGPPVDIADVDDRLPELLSNSRSNSRPAVPNLPSSGHEGMASPRKQEFGGLPDPSSDSSMASAFDGADFATAQRMAKEAYDIGYTTPLASQPLPRPHIHSTAPAYQQQAPLRNPEVEQLQSADDSSDGPNSSQPHTSFHSMHFPDPPMTARLPPQNYASQHSSPRSPSTMSSTSSTSTLMNGVRESPAPSAPSSTLFNKKASIINLNDINISFSPLMGGSSPEFSRAGFSPHTSFAPSNLMTSMSAGQIASPTSPVTPTITSSQSGPVGSSIPSTKYSELQAASGKPKSRQGSGQSASSAGSGSDSGSSFGRRLLRRQSGAFLVRAGLIDDKSKHAKAAELNASGSPSTGKGFVPGGLGLSSPSVPSPGLGLETPRSASFGRKDRMEIVGSLETSQSSKMAPLEAHSL
ncbi:hypothetical protein ANO11243_072790 [Dothideomycetidae sp. 11243]|nr:hypothetical protein ANO11243_072790 [fungal sp. No.11243]